MKDSANEARWDRVNEYLRGEASAETVAALEKELREDDEFCAEFIEYANVDLGLALLVGSTASETDNVVPFPRPVDRRKLMTSVAAVAACVAFAAWFVVTSISHPFARVVHRIGVEHTLSDLASLRGEEVRLARGLLELETAQGARVVIEAPARFRFESAQQLRLEEGRVAATVPPSAKGFSVLTRSGKAIDLGTEFGVDVPAKGEPEIHVFDGEVIAQSENGTRQSLLGGEAFSLTSGSGLSRELRSGAFIGHEEVASLLAGFEDGQRARSEAMLASLRRDPALIALMDFESGDLPGGQYRMVQGRWPGSKATEYVSKGDHMKLDIGGGREWPQLTLAAWVRLDRLGAPYQSLLHTDGWNADNPGQVHWMVTRLNTMRLALRGNTLPPGSASKFGYPDSRTSVLPEQGRWVHLAAVYDSEAATVRFYLNGRFDVEARQKTAHAARLGPAQIGNWDRNDRKLSGRIDELVLLGRAMSDDEISVLFAAGNPYRK